MGGRVRFVTLLHSHQPVGNFDHVIEDAYERCYLPHVNVFADYPNIPLTQHYSGCLLEWLLEKHPEYLERLNELVNPKGSHVVPWEMIGGGLQEPVMPMLPERDCIGQITRMSDFLEKHFQKRPRGYWLTERVWEPALAKRLAQAGVQYLTLDDSHFMAAGLEACELVGGFITEDEGRMVTVYPASERLRYLIPFAQVSEVVDYLRSLVPDEGERVVCYADDGEKFGVWPNTFRTVYEEGWLHNFLRALQQAQDEGWLICSTLGEAYDEVGVVGKVYLPENSYREMTEWALPAHRLAALEKTLQDVKDDANVAPLLPMVRGGNWRSFRTKYSECGQMYGKMMEVSRRVDALPEGTNRDQALAQLYKGQCNCPYWHGVFGGLYLPHLRSAVYQALIRSELLCDSDVGIVSCDFDFDGQSEIKISNEHLALYFHPERGGHLYEFDVRRIAFNVGDTFSRRFEAYHEKVSQAVVGDGSGESIHAAVRAKESGLEALLQYDHYLRESFVDHISPRALTPDDFLSGRPPSDEGFRQEAYEVSIPKDAPSGGWRVDFTRSGEFQGQALHIRKSVFLGDDAAFQVSYKITNESTERIEAFFAVEMNYALLAGDAPDRFYFHEKTENAGKLATQADFGIQSMIGLKDQWLDVALTLRPSKPAQVLVSPVLTVSQSEGGFESVYQNSSVVLQWPLALEAGESFEVVMLQEVSSA